MEKFTQELGASVLVLTEAEREFLDKYGNWLVALESGRILPKTDRQHQFLAVIRNEARPQHPNEHLWLRVREAKEAVRRQHYLEDERAELVNRLAAQSLGVKDLQDELESVRKKLGWQNQLITKLQQAISKYEPIVPVTTRSNSAYGTCRQCGGDGGAGGRCPRCGGNGFEPQGT